MKLTVERDTVFIPEFRDNDQESWPVKIKLRQLTTGERQRLLKIDPVNLALSASNGGGYQFDVNYEGLFTQAVQGIENLEVNNERITTAEAFLKAPGLQDLFLEVVMEIVKQNSRKDDDLKN